jgi:hypothetical protein
MHDTAYTALGYHAGLFGVGSGFDSAVITTENIAAYILMEKLIFLLEKANLETPMTELLTQYRKNVLTPGFEDFKYYNLTIQPNMKKTLGTFFNDIERCTHQIYSKRATKLANKVTSGVNQLGSQIQSEGLSIGLLNNMVNQASHSIKENSDLIKVFSFNARIQALLESPNASTQDLLALKNESNLMRETILNMPETKEITRFHWFINLMCNFINKYINNAFESKMSVEFKGFFSDFDVHLQRAEAQQRKINNMRYSVKIH